MAGHRKFLHDTRDTTPVVSAKNLSRCRHSWKAREKQKLDPFICHIAFDAIGHARDKMLFSRRVAFCNALRHAATPPEMREAGRALTWPDAIFYLTPEMILAVSKDLDPEFKQEYPEYDEDE